MKTIVFEKHTKDVDGLLAELRREVGPVITVASDAARTYVYVDQDSDLDPKLTVHKWEDTPELRVEFTNRIGEEGLPLAWADGFDLHNILIQKTTGYGDLIPDSGKLVIVPGNNIPVSHRKVKLKGGVASVAVGPTTKPGTVSISIEDPLKRMKAVSVQFRFVEPPPDHKEDVDPALIQKTEKPSVWAVFRRILKI